MMENEGNHPTSADTLRRVDRLERDLSNLTDKVINLSDLVVSTNTNVDNLVDQVGNLFGRTQPKPPNYQLGIALVTLLVIIMTLAFTPLYKEDARQAQFDQYMMRHLENDAREMGQIEADLEWLKRLEKRSNDRIHGDY